MPTPDGSIGHCEARIGDSIVMMGDATGDAKPSQSTTMVYANDCDTAFKRALEAGAISVIPLADQFYGDRSGR